MFLVSIIWHFSLGPYWPKFWLRPWIQCKLNPLLWRFWYYSFRDLYFWHFNFVIIECFVKFMSIVPFYDINLDAMSLFSDSSFSFLTTLNYIIINQYNLYRFEWQKYNVFLVLKNIELNYTNIMLHHWYKFYKINSCI